MSVRGGTDALDLETGRPVWSTESAARPLVLVGERLVAQAESLSNPDILQILILNARTGEVLRQAEVRLPEGVSTLVNDRMDSSFRVAPHVSGGDVVLTWVFTKRYVGGVRPAPGPEDSQSQEQHGAVRIDLETGSASSIPYTGPASSEHASLQSEKVRTMLGSGTIPPLHWVTGGIVAATARVPMNKGERVVLRRWDAHTGSSLPEVTLFDQRLTIRYPSADRRHLLASGAVESGAAADRAGAYRWLVFDLQTAERAADFTTDVLAATFFLLGSDIIHELLPRMSMTETGSIEEPRRLRAISLRTGNTRWTWPLRDTTYRGPFPAGEDMRTGTVEGRSPGRSGSHP